MSSKYDSNKLDPTADAESRKNYVRFLTGDTNSRGWLLDDNEINAELNLADTNVFRAGAQCSRRIAAQFARKADFSIGKASTAAGQRMDHYLRLAATLESEDLAGVDFGGFDQQQRDTLDQDESIIQPHFKTGDMDFPGTLREDDNDRDNDC